SNALSRPSIPSRHCEKSCSTPWCTVAINPVCMCRSASMPTASFAGTTDRSHMNSHLRSCSACIPPIRATHSSPTLVSKLATSTAGAEVLRRLPKPASQQISPHQPLKRLKAVCASRSLPRHRPMLRAPPDKSPSKSPRVLEMLVFELCCRSCGMYAVSL
ncbi:MAG: hypothetical protein ACI8Z5_002301, partial [Lentimonas sp.]